MAITLFLRNNGAFLLGKSSNWRFLLVESRSGWVKSGRNGPNRVSSGHDGENAFDLAAKEQTDDT
jgi:hypothetical protein